MELICTKDNLQKAISNVGRIVTVHSGLPVLSNILFETDKGRLKLSATDLEIGISTYVGAKISQIGKITIPARLLTEFITTNNDETIELKINKQAVDLKSDRFFASIKGLPADDFPQIPQVESQQKILIPAVVLSEAIRQVVFAAAVDETRPILAGVLFSFDGPVLNLVATDSYRLAEKKINLASSQKTEGKVIVPGRALMEVARITSFEVENVEVTIGENQIKFKTKSSEIVSRVIDGNFPDYQQIIPQNKKTTLEIAIKELSQALKMASYFARDNNNNIKLKTEKNHLLVIANSPNSGENVSTVNVVAEGEPVDISFNVKYLIDVLNVMDCEKIILELNGKINPGLIKPEKSKDYQYVAMPLRLEE